MRRTSENFFLGGFWALGLGFRVQGLGFRVYKRWRRIFFGGGLGFCFTQNRGIP